MEHTPVTSSMVTHVGYDPETRELHLTYKGGKVYKHAAVPPEVHQALMTSPSMGKHINANIKGRYALVP